MTTASQPETILTPKSHDLFMAFAEDADNWSGTPHVGCNVGLNAETRGNLTHLKKAGLIYTTVCSEGQLWLSFTDAGKEYAARHGITL